ncbi:conserved hypothetical protein [Ricinus communis]|uniref:Uncharacterized protein n=1 Tax=Ricinus communis TaxID=3988 RepID=B9S5A4_RICCO|nr:conserved hypothetical protein [Ricinus communis]
MKLKFDLSFEKKFGVDEKTNDDHKDNSVGDGSFVAFKDDSSDNDENQEKYIVKLVYESQKQFDTPKEFNVDAKEDVIEEENFDVSGCKDDVLKKNNYDGDDSKNGNFVHKDCNMGDDKVDVGMCDSGVVGTSDDNVGIGTSVGNHDVRDELVEDIDADKAVDYANISSTVNLNSGADTLVYSKKVIKSSFVFKLLFFTDFDSFEGENAERIS